MSHIAWMAQAESDLGAARLLGTNGCHSQAVWVAAQAVEKAHKAILFALGLRYTDPELKKMSHEISWVAGLLPEALHEPTDPRVASAITALQALALKARYPTAAAPLRPKQPPGPVVAPVAVITDSQTVLADAAMLLEWCRERIARALRAAETMRAPAPLPTEDRTDGQR